MSNARATVVLGASGSVGDALVKELIRNGSFKSIVTLVRRSQPAQVTIAHDAGVDLRETLVPTMDPASLEAATTGAIRPLDGDVVGLSVLGVGAGTAKLTIDEHRAVDVQLNAAFARGLKASGRVKHLAFMSAAGADPTAAATGSGAAGMARYARVKGEAEDAVRESGPAVVIGERSFGQAPRAANALTKTAEPTSFDPDLASAPAPPQFAFGADALRLDGFPSPKTDSQESY